MCALHYCNQPIFKSNSLFKWNSESKEYMIDKISGGLKIKNHPHPMTRKIHLNQDKE